MKKKLETFLYGRLSRHAITDDHEKYLYLISFAACTFIFSMHFFLLFLHLAVNLLSLFIMYLISFLVDFVLFWLVERGRYQPFGLLLSGVVIVNTLVSAVCIGTRNLVIVYLLVTLMMQIIIPYASTRIRGLVISALWASMVATILINSHMTPLHDIGHANGVLAMFNVHLAFFGTIIQLTVGNSIRDTILRYNRAELEKSKGEANTDPLTGLFNRRYAGKFFDKLTSGQLEQVWCVAMVDIDDFKLLNDAHGHLAGDDVLMFISNLLRSNLRRTDLVFRWGGEEFLILLKDANISAAFLILDNLRAKLASENIETHGETLNVTITIGVCPLDIDDVEGSIDRCDHLMYEGKALGKNRVVM